MDNSSYPAGPLASEQASSTPGPQLASDALQAPYAIALDAALSPSPAPSGLAPLGPWYHTAGIVLLLLVYAFVGHLTHHQTVGAATASRVEQSVHDTAQVFAETPKVPLYASTMMLSWMLLASVVAGLYHRRAFFLSTLRRRFESRWVDPALGVAIYLSFLATISMLVLLFTTFLMVRAHHAHVKPAVSAEGKSGQQHSIEEADTLAANDAKAVQERVQRLLHVNRNAVASLAPQTVPELLLWIALSFTAGFCEEHIFRGYLLRQTITAMHGLTLPRWLGATLSVLATSALFGSLHLYEGVGGAVIVGLLGAVLAVMTLVLGNLRAVIVAHFLQDLVGGLAYYIAHVRHAL